MKKLHNECQQYFLDNPDQFEQQVSTQNRFKIDYSINVVVGSTTETSTMSKKKSNKKSEGLDSW